MTDPIEIIIVFCLMGAALCALFISTSGKVSNDHSPPPTPPVHRHVSPYMSEEMEAATSRVSRKVYIPNKEANESESNPI